VNTKAQKNGGAHFVGHTGKIRVSQSTYNIIMCEETHANNLTLAN